jgi:hypothetical protein
MGIVKTAEFRCTLFFPQGWSSAYSIESVIMQINATLVKGKARVQFGANKVLDEELHRRAGVPRLACLTSEASSCLDSIFKIYFCVYECLPVCMCLYCMCAWCPLR